MKATVCGRSALAFEEAVGLLPPLPGAPHTP